MARKKTYPGGFRLTLAVAVANKAFKAFTRPAFCTSRLKTEPFYKSSWKYRVTVVFDEGGGHEHHL